MEKQHKPLIAVLGASGFLGSHIVAALVNQGYTVRAFSTRPFINPFVGVSTQCIPYTGDFFNLEDLKTVLTGCSYCFHVVSTSLPKTSNENPIEDIQKTLCGTIKMLDLAVACGVKKIIFASSGGTVYGEPSTLLIAEEHPTHPLCSYGITKLSIEKYLDIYRRTKSLEYVVLRIANPYGPLQRPKTRQGVIGIFLNNLLHKKPLEVWGDGTAIRDYIYIEDVAQACIHAMEKEPLACVINIGSGTGITINDLIQEIQEVTGENPQVVYRAPRAFDVPRNVLDITKAYQLFQWKPKVTLQQGLHDTWKWLISEKNTI